MGKVATALNDKLGRAELREFYGDVEAALDRLMAALGEKPMPAGSRALQFAVEAGFEKKALYSVPDTAKYLGIGAATLRDEHNAGRIAFVVPKCGTRPYVYVDEVDRWLEASSDGRGGEYAGA